jgi:hypothetical protein
MISFIHSFSSVNPSRFALGVVLYKILVGKRSHPYLSEAELKVVYALPRHLRNQKAAALIIDSPGVMWPEGVRVSYSPPLISVVEKLLSHREENRGGLNNAILKGHLSSSFCSQERKKPDRPWRHSRVIFFGAAAAFLAVPFMLMRQAGRR